MIHVPLRRQGYSETEIRMRDLTVLATARGSTLHGDHFFGGLPGRLLISLVEFEEYLIAHTEFRQGVCFYYSGFLRLRLQSRLYYSTHPVLTKE